MVGKDKIGESKAIELERANEHSNPAAEDKGFADVTDLKNEDFIYVY